MCDSSIKACKSQDKIGYTETIFTFSYNLLKIILAISKTSMILFEQLEDYGFKEEVAIF